MPSTQYSLEQLLSDWENDRELLEPRQYRRRMEVLDQLDAYSPSDSSRVSAEMLRRQSNLIETLHSANIRLTDSIRLEIREGRCPEIFLQFLGPTAGGISVARGLSYDYLDDLLGDILRFEPPTKEPLALEPEEVFYQPTPARHIFELIRAAGIKRSDTIIDLGSGLGHVPLLVSICTGASAVGVELDPAWVASAQKCAESLKLSNVTFLAQDARDADLSSGTLFYLYTPFRGSVLRSVIESLRREASMRPIRVCTFGPCTLAISEQPWLKATASPEADRVTIFVPCE